MKPFTAVFLHALFTINVVVLINGYSDRATLGARLIRSVSTSHVNQLRSSTPREDSLSQDANQVKRINALEDVLTSSYKAEQSKNKNADSTRRSSVDETRELDRELNALPDNDDSDLAAEVQETLKVRNVDENRRKRDVNQDQGSNTKDTVSSSSKKSTITGKEDTDLMGTAGALDEDPEMDEDSFEKDDSEFSKKDELDQLEKDDKFDDDEKLSKKNELDDGFEEDSKSFKKDESDDEEGDEESDIEEKLKDEDDSDEDDDESKNNDDDDTEEGEKKSGIEKSEDDEEKDDARSSSDSRDGDKKSEGLDTDDDTAETKVSCRTECAPAMDYETCAVPRCDYKVGTIRDLCQFLCHHQKEHCEEVCD